MQYKYWLRLFNKDKKLISTYDICHVESVHSIRRYVDKDNRIWETAITYTNKIVVRRGLPEEAGTIRWFEWETLHEVEFE